MALIVKSYGNGELGDVAEINSTINSYACVTAISTNTVTINATTQVEGAARFKVGAQILFHISTSKDAAYTKYLGKWFVATITAINSNVLTIDRDPTKLIPQTNFAQYNIQIVAFAQYKNLTLSTGSKITPIVYSAANFYGGIVAIMCSNTLKFDGGHILLTDRGIPAASKTLRPVLKQENLGTKDIQPYSGWENYCADTCPLNAGDGAAFIFAKSMVGDFNSRIGNISAYGVQFYRGSTDSVVYNKETLPTKVTNVGGSTILIAAETIEDFSPRMISKYRSSASGSTAGQGLARCYIASNTKLRNDEGLYSYDIVSDPNRLEEMNIKDFGDGSVGDITEHTTQLNNYAKITSIKGKTLTYINQTTAGLAQIQAGALVMIHFAQKTTGSYAYQGTFILAKVLSDNGTELTLDTEPPLDDLNNYYAQVVAIPQFRNFVLSKTNSSTPAFSSTKGTGGILAIAVQTKFDLSGGTIYVPSSSSPTPYGREGLATVGNAQNFNILPLGQGRGSIFLLANQLVMNTSTRIGGTADGSYFGGHTGGTETKPSGGYKGTYNSGTTSAAYCGSGAAGGVYNSSISGGYGGAGYGGSGRQGSSTLVYGGYNGGSAGLSLAGGSSGRAFVYCNHAVDQNITGTVYED